MAAKLQCEICGGKLVGMPGGVFECEACGTEYSTAWAKAKIQEITGTVKVEGTVEVTGKVQIDGPVKVEGGVNKEALLQRGNLALEDGQWDKAREHFDQALSLDAEYADAWLGLTMADYRFKRERDFGRVLDGQQPVEHNANYRKFLRFASSERAHQIAAYLTAAESRKKQRKAEREAHKKAEDAARAAFREKLPVLRDDVALARSTVAVGLHHVVGLREDGTVASTASSDYRAAIKNVFAWKDIIAIAAGNYHTVGLKLNGTVVATGKNREEITEIKDNVRTKRWIEDGRCNVFDWKNIVAIDAGFEHTVGLKSDGRVIAVGMDGDVDSRSHQWKKDGRCDVWGWTDIVAIAAGGKHTVGLKKDGTVVAVGDNHSGQCDVSEWKEIVAIEAFDFCTVGYQADGTALYTVSGPRGSVTFTARNVVSAIPGGYMAFLRNDGTAAIDREGRDAPERKKAISTWNNLVSVLITDHILNLVTVGLNVDGKILADNNGDQQIWNCTKEWSDVAALAFRSDILYGVKKDGTVLQSDSPDERDVSNWKLFESLASLKENREVMMKKAEVERKAVGDAARLAHEALLKERDDLSAEFRKLKGPFSGKRRKEINERMTEIFKELEKLAKR